jgi:aspartyl-tRNA(Asn)/glutamyl-tRNA(Gln) amidotransferase subunit B
MRSSQEASAYLIEVHRLLRYLNICDGNMEEGSFRCDANVSVRLFGAPEFGKKVEVKNMNSFRNVARAIDKEAERQIALIEAGQEVDSETRMFDGGTGETYSLRSKETLNDYRYFPEADLQPVVITDAHLACIRAELPALPKELFLQFTTEFGLSPYDANVLIEERETADYFLIVCKLTKNYKAASNWITGPMKALQNSAAKSLKELSLSPEHLAELISLIDIGKLSFSVASQRLLPVLVETGAAPLQAAVEHNLIMDQDAAGLEPIILEILERYPDKVQEYKAGKKGLLGLFVGEVMKATKGKANPKDANRLVTEALEK